MSPNRHVSTPQTIPEPIRQIFLDARSSLMAPKIGDRATVMSMLDANVSDHMVFRVAGSVTTTCVKKIEKSRVLMSSVND